MEKMSSDKMLIKLMGEVDKLECINDTKINIMNMIEELSKIIKADEKDYDLKFIDETIRRYSSNVSSEVSNRCSNVMRWCKSIEAENKELEKQLINKITEINDVETNRIDAKQVVMNDEAEKALSIYRRMKERKPNKKDVSNEDIVMLYCGGNGLGATAIGKKVGLSRQQVVNRLKSEGKWRPKPIRKIEVNLGKSEGLTEGKHG